MVVTLKIKFHVGRVKEINKVRSHTIIVLPTHKTLPFLKLP